jgi:hypothetical protein
MPDDTQVSPRAGVNIGGRAGGGGDVVGRDKIVNHIRNIHQRALTVAEESARPRSPDSKPLAKGVAGGLAVCVSNIQAVLRLAQARASRKLNFEERVQFLYKKLACPAALAAPAEGTP